jgi:adenosylcobinamide-phosphate synthase
MLFQDTHLGFIAPTIFIGLLIDRYFGEPPIAIHPVVLMGNYLGWVSRWWAPKKNDHCSQSNYFNFFCGAFFWACGAAIALLIGFEVQLILKKFNFYLGVFLGGLILNCLLSWRLLQEEVLGVSKALDSSLRLARNQLSRLVSRDVTDLNEAQVCEGAIETLAENLNDSLVAPLLWFAIGGLPAAALYRYANTADAMWGYRGMYKGHYWEWFGKVAARVDDLMSWLPAILTAFLISLVSKKFAWIAIWQNSRKTPSPNGGWPMSAMALALKVRLNKPGVYSLNTTGRPPQLRDIKIACSLGSRVVVLLLMVTFIAAILSLLIPLAIL